MDLTKLRPFLPAARYAFVIATGLFLFTASTNYLSTTAIEQIKPAPSSATARPAAVRVPDPPVAVPAPAPEPSKAPSLPLRPATAVAETTPAPAAPAAPTAPSPEPNAAMVEVAATADSPDLAPISPEPSVLDASQPVANAGLPPVGGAATHVVVSAVNLRAAPSNAGARLGVLQGGQRVTVTAEDGGWMQVEENGVVRGWVYGSFLQSL